MIATGNTGAPSKIHTVHLVKIQPEEMLATPQNLTPPSVEHSPYHLDTIGCIVVLVYLIFHVLVVSKVDCRGLTRQNRIVSSTSHL